MAQDLERIERRLENVRAVNPILAALRTISLGSWQRALGQVRGLEAYSERLLALLPVLLPHLQESPNALWRPLNTLVQYLPWVGKKAPDRVALAQERDAQERDAQERVIALIIGSERGLCGRYNANLVEYAGQYFAEMEQRGTDLEVAALGSRIIRLLHRREYPLRWSQSLPVTRLPAFEMAFQLTREWLQKYEAAEIDAVDVLYNDYAGPGDYTATVTRLLPPDLPSAEPLAPDEERFGASYIVETDPLRLYVRIMEQWTAINFHTLLLTAAASEHSARFQLMESATQNVEGLVEELTQELQSARRQAITLEMQELAVSAGLLGKENQSKVRGER